MISRKSTRLSICRCNSRGRSLNGEFRSSCLFTRPIWGNFIVNLQQIVGLVVVPLKDWLFKQCSTLWFLNGELCLLQAQMPNIRSSHDRFIIPLLFLELTFAYT